MKSKIISKKPVDKKHIIVVDDVQIDPKTIEMHRQRINTIFANQSEEYRLEQLNKMIMHDILFSKAMDYLFTHYEFSIDKEDLDKHINFVVGSAKDIDANNMSKQLKEAVESTAKKLIIQKLIFDDIQKENNITVSDDELEKILIGYYKETNQPIRTFKQDPQRYEEARTSIINEKVIGTIISMFEFNLDKFLEKVNNFKPTNKDN